MPDSPKRAWAARNRAPLSCIGLRGGALLGRETLLDGVADTNHVVVPRDGRKKQPEVGVPIVRRYATAVRVQRSEIGLSLSQALLGRLTVLAGPRPRQAGGQGEARSDRAGDRKAPV